MLSKPGLDVINSTFYINNEMVIAYFSNSEMDKAMVWVVVKNNITLIHITADQSLEDSEGIKEMVAKQLKALNAAPAKP